MIVIIANIIVSIATSPILVFNQLYVIVTPVAILAVVTSVKILDHTVSYDATVH